MTATLRVIPFAVILEAGPASFLGGTHRGQNRHKQLGGLLMYSGKTLFFLTGLPRTGTSWTRRMLDSHPQIVCKGEARIMTSPFTQGKGLWDYLYESIHTWVLKEGSRKGNGFIEPEREEIAWRQGSPLVTTEFLRREATGLTTVAATSLVQYLLLGNITDDEIATGEKTPVIKTRDINRFEKLRKAGLSLKVIGLHRKFSDWFKSYHKHDMFRWETTHETLDFYPFTRDDYIKAVRAVRDEGKAPGQLVTPEQVELAYNMYTQVNSRLADVCDLFISYEFLTGNLQDSLRQMFEELGVSTEESHWIAEDLSPDGKGNSDQDASKHTLEEYFGDEAIIKLLRHFDEETGDDHYE